SSLCPFSSVPEANPGFTVTEKFLNPISPAAIIGKFQTTWLPESVPSSLAERKLVFTGTSAVSTTFGAALAERLPNTILYVSGDPGVTGSFWSSIPSSSTGVLFTSTVLFAIVGAAAPVPMPDVAYDASACKNIGVPSGAAGEATTKTNIVTDRLCPAL